MSWAEGTGPGQAVGAVLPPIPPALLQRPRRRENVLFTILVSVALFLGACVMALVLLASGAPDAIVIGAVLAALPVGPLVACYLWLDRYEPEPMSLLGLAFGWGAFVATAVALILQGFDQYFVGTSEDWSAAIVAPLTEEFAKGLFVVLLLWFRRNELDGILDGLVYAGLVGVGFAFTENILYFGRAFLAGSEDLGLSGGIFAVGLTFVLRGVLSPFAHPLFTVMTGIGFGVAAGTRSTAVRVFAPVIGYLAAVLLHSAWNYSAVGGLGAFLTGYALIMVPAFALVVAVAVWSRRREGAIVATWLPAYAEAGWMAPEDVAMLSSLRARRQAVEWAKGVYGERGARALQAFQHAATELAFLRDRAERGTAHEDFIQRERSLLAEVARTRAAIAAPLTY
jgi:RsiW-degrading membrane proteinase PrsW (M82 family)